MEATSSSSTLLTTPRPESVLSAMILKPGRRSSKPKTLPYTQPNTAPDRPQQAMMLPSHNFFHRASTSPMRARQSPWPRSPNMMPKNRQ